LQRQFELELKFEQQQLQFKQQLELKQFQLELQLQLCFECQQQLQQQPQFQLVLTACYSDIAQPPQGRGRNLRPGGALGGELRRLERLPIPAVPAGPGLQMSVRQRDRR
jgi:hypothetical protein